MGFNQNNFDKFKKFLESFAIDKPNTVITELGSQQSWIAKSTEFPPKSYFNLHFKDDFKKINSIDLRPDFPEVNIIDLRDIMPFQHIEMLKADIVMNLGTTEHVSSLRGQYNAWVNLYQLCKVGGYMIHDIPEKGSWKNHPCCFWYDDRFFRGLPGEVIEFDRLNTKGQGFTDWCVIKKIDEELITYDQFVDLLK